MCHVAPSDSFKCHLGVAYELPGAGSLAVLSQLVEPLRNVQARSGRTVDHPVDAQFYAVGQEHVVLDKAPKAAGNLEVRESKFNLGGSYWREDKFHTVLHVRSVRVRRKPRIISNTSSERPSNPEILSGTVRLSVDAVTSSRR